MKILDKLWFSGLRGTVGVVLGEDEETGKHKAYIGAILVGLNEESDARDVAECGSKLNYATAQRIANWLQDKK